MQDAKTCSKCGQPMTQGFIANHTYGAVNVSLWIEGAPRASFWKKIKAPAAKSLPVATFRCVGCGFLESYAAASYGVQR